VFYRDGLIQGFSLRAIDEPNYHVTFPIRPDPKHLHFCFSNENLRSIVSDAKFVDALPISGISERIKESHKKMFGDDVPTPHIYLSIYIPSGIIDDVESMIIEYVKEFVGVLPYTIFVKCQQNRGIAPQQIVYKLLEKKLLSNTNVYELCIDKQYASHTIYLNR